MSDTDMNISADTMLDTVAKYLEQNGWKVFVIGSPSVHHNPGDLELNYQFVLKFTGRKINADS